MRKEERTMFHAVISMILTLLGGVVGFFLGSGLNQPVEMMLFGGLVAGVGCIVYAIKGKE